MTRWRAIAMRSLTSLSSAEIGTLAALVDQGRPSEAEHRTRVLLAEHPDSGLLWKILGVALVRQDKDALQPLLRAAELLPLDAEAHRNLGGALYDRGQWPAALLSLQSAIAIQPEDPGALIDAGNASRALGRTAEAVPLYQAALKLKPDQVEAHNNLGNAYLELDHHQEAADCYRRAPRPATRRSADSQQPGQCTVAHRPSRRGARGWPARRDTHSGF